MLKSPDVQLKRHLSEHLINNSNDLEKMVFIAGPRQCGKTTLVRALGSQLGFKNIAYLNWDRLADQRIIRDIHFTYFRELMANSEQKPLILFDELHKYRGWKTFLKGYYDTFHKDLATIVTGSARLDIYRRGGDSLFGRYWLYHLYPLSLSELLGVMNPGPPSLFKMSESQHQQQIFDNLFHSGGFPDPYLHGTPNYHRRWVRMRRERLIKEDLRDLSRIQDLAYVENLMELILASVGSTLSLNSLRESLDVSYNAVKTWVKWLEQIYYCFRVDPYAKKLARGFKKEGKYFPYDWSELEDDAKKFESFIAMHLKKSVDYWNDSGEGDFKLCFVRDHEKHEVDFLLLKNKKPWMLVECKLSSDDIPVSLHYMAERLHTEHNVLVNASSDPGRSRVYKSGKYWVTGAGAFLRYFV